jgi:cytochrome c5
MVAVSPSETWERPSRHVTMAIVLALLLPVAHAQAQGDPRTGKDVVDAVCASCHFMGDGGAPRIGDPKAWGKRSAQGLSSLTRSALEGIRTMPPHGGNPGLSDLEIRRAVTYMVNQSGGRWNEPIDKSAPLTPRSGEAIVRAQCGRCHESGAGGAPRIGDKEAWTPRLKAGFDKVTASAIRGHGGMPARGGMADLTDAELRGAIAYMFNPAAPPK